MDQLKGILSPRLSRLSPVSCGLSLATGDRRLVTGNMNDHPLEIPSKNSELQFQKILE